MSHGWYTMRRLGEDLTALTEPAVHDFFRANLFLLRGRDFDLLVDTGMGLVPLRPYLPLTPGKPVVALATHIHLDHVGAMHEFEDRWGPDYSAPGFASMPDALTYADMFRAFDAPLTTPPEPGWRAVDYRLRPAPLTRALAEGDVVDLGDRRFTVLHLPGHSPDSVALFDEADGTFFCGDAIYPGGLIDDLPDSDPVAYRETMTRILGLDVSAAHGGHGASMTREEMVAVAEAYLREGKA